MCGQVKPVNEFHRCNRNTTGFQAYCKSCKKNHAQNRYLQKGEHIRAVNSSWSKNNLEHHNSLRKEWRDVHGTAATRLSQLNATGHAPTWLSDDDIVNMKQIYIKAKEQGLVVDHVIPLRGKLVSGLHVPSNLQLLKVGQNSYKGNRYEIN